MRRTPRIVTAVAVALSLMFAVAIPAAAVPTGPVPAVTTGAAKGLVFGPYKDVTQHMYWGTGYTMGTDAVNGKQMPLVGKGTTLHSSLPQLKSITLAFATGACGSENWGGVPGADLADYNIDGLNSAGIDYIVSTGGGAGTFTCKSATGMRKFIDRYAGEHLIGVDFDIETGQTTKQIRQLVSAVAAVQSRYPKLRFSFTIATLAASDGSGAGVNRTGAAVIKAVLAAKLKRYTINLMTMDYGPIAKSICVVRNGRCDMGKSAIQAVKNLRQAYPKIPLSKIEVTPMIGVNDIEDEVFTLQDATELTTWAKAHRLAGIHYWALDRDTRLRYTKRFLKALGRL